MESNTQTTSSHADTNPMSVQQALTDGKSRSHLLVDAVNNILEQINSRGGDPSKIDLDELSRRAFNETRLLFAYYNDSVKKLWEAKCGKGVRPYNTPNMLSPGQASMLVRAHETVRVIVNSDDEVNGGILTVYRDGVYREITETDINDWGEAIVGTADVRWRTELRKTLYVSAERAVENDDPSLIFVENGIYDYQHKMIMDFTPEIVRMSKAAVALPDKEPEMPSHTNPDTGESQTLEEVLRSWCPYDGGIELLVQVAGAALRNLNNWRTSVWLYSPVGSNGKSCYQEMLQALVGDRCVFRQSFEALCGDRFGLKGIQGKSLVICGDSNQGAYVKKSDRFKCIAAHEPVTIEGKGENVYQYRPHALIVAAMNDLAGFRDKGASIIDRLTIVPFKTRFVDEQRDPTIKTWMASREVCEYMAWWALCGLPEYAELSKPEEAMCLSREYRVENDSMLDFVTSYLDDACDGLLYAPYHYLFNSYRDWLERNRPGTKPGNITRFNKSLREYVDKSKWHVPDHGEPKRLFSKWNPGVPEHRYYGYYDKRDRGLVRTDVYEHCEARGVTPNDVGQSYSAVVNAVNATKNSVMPSPLKA